MQTQLYTPNAFSLWFVHAQRRSAIIAGATAASVVVVVTVEPDEIQLFRTYHVVTLLDVHVDVAGQLVHILDLIVRLGAGCDDDEARRTLVSAWKAWSNSHSAQLDTMNDDDDDGHDPHVYICKEVNTTISAVFSFNSYLEHDPYCGRVCIERGDSRTALTTY